LKNWYNPNKAEVDALREKSTRLKQNVNLAIGVDIIERQRLADERRMLDRIKPPAGSFFDPGSKKRCMEDTRANLMDTLVSFAVSEDTSKRLFLLSGIAGCGKTSVATSVANLLYQRDCLLGSFFFQIDNEKMRIPAYLLHTVAYSLALRNESYKKAIMEVLNNDEIIVENQGLSIQFNELLRKPLNRMPSTSISHTLSHRAIVIDALDECDDPQSVSSYLAEIVGLAPWLKVIITSRPLEDVEANLGGKGYMTHRDLFAVDASDDILKFTQSRFDPGGPLHQLQSRVTVKDIQALAERSHRLFIWIQTVLSYLDTFPFTTSKLEEIKSILSSTTAASPEKGLDQLYLRVLRTVAKASPHYEDAVKNLVGLIYATSRNRPLPCTGLHAFIPTPSPNASATPEDVRHLRSKLAAVITIDPKTEALQVCHPSFLDFVASETRSQEFWTKPEVLDAIIAEKCLSVLKAGQTSNVGRRVSNCDEVVKQQIPQELAYSAVYWLDHLSRSQASESSDEKLMHTFKGACKFLYHGGLPYLLDLASDFNTAMQVLMKFSDVISQTLGRLSNWPEIYCKIRILSIGRVNHFLSTLLVPPTLIYV
jgi:hypothetical protein